MPSCNFISLASKLMVVLALFAGPPAWAQTFTALHSFVGGSDGSFPRVNLVQDPSGVLYGTTASGGGSTNCTGGCGTVFKVDTNGTETVLYSFTGGADGSGPTSSLILGPNHTVDGTTGLGGAHGWGTVFKIDTIARVETVLYSFTGGADGGSPQGGVIQDSAGNLYGTTFFGGDLNCQPLGCGVVFKLTPNGSETVLHTFSGGSDGSNPHAALVRDAAGNLYGTTYENGIYHRGTAFKINASGIKTVLHSFTGKADGSRPLFPLVLDGAGNLYGVTDTGGTGCGGLGCGIVFKLTSTGAETVLYTFTGAADGAGPTGVLALDKPGNLYGGSGGGGSANSGVLFKLSTSGVETVLYNFSTGENGFDPEGLIRDAAGNLYGAAQYGGDPTCNCGVVFKFTP